MKFIQDQQPHQCRLVAESAEVTLWVQGLSANELAACFGIGPSKLLAGSEGQCRDMQIGGAGELPVIDLPKAITRQLPDGRVSLTSGGPARLSLTRPSGLTRLLIPQTLHLALAQQWARHGLMPVHACAFELDGTGILALGEQGAGKSVLSMAARIAGGGVVSDDWILLGPAPSGGVGAERLRQFLMLRDGAALKSMQPRLAALERRTVGEDGKLCWPVPSDQIRFPKSCRIDQLWLLAAPAEGRGHPAVSSHQPADQADAFGKMVESGMPLLFSDRFPAEGQALTTTLLTLLSTCVLRRVATGTDLISNPSSVLSRLIDAA